MWMSCTLPGFETGSVAQCTHGTVFRQCHASLIHLCDWEARAGDGLQRQFDDEIPPLCTLRSCPHQQQFLDRHTDTQGLSDDKDSRTAMVENESSKVPGYRTAVVRDQWAKTRVRVEWRFLSLKRLVPSVRGLAAAGPAGGDTAWDVAYTHAVHSGPAGSPPGD